jgi:hypothetical protein
MGLCCRENLECDFCNGAGLQISHEGIVVKLLERLMRDNAGNIRPIWRFMMNTGKSILGKSILRQFTNIADVAPNL